MQLTFEKIKRKSHKNEFEWVEYLYENKLFICNNNDEELLLECMLITFFAESCDEFISFICLYKIQRILGSWCIFWRHSYHFEWHSTLRDEIDDKKNIKQILSKASSPLFSRTIHIRLLSLLLYYASFFSSLSFTHACSDESTTFYSIHVCLNSFFSSYIRNKLLS